MKDKVREIKGLYSTLAAPNDYDNEQLKKAEEAEASVEMSAMTARNAANAARGAVARTNTALALEQAKLAREAYNNAADKFNSFLNDSSPPMNNMWGEEKPEREV